AGRCSVVACGLELDGLRREVSAESLGYVSLDVLVAASEQPRSRLCTACFDGDYPIPLPDDALIGKHVLEDMDGAAEQVHVTDHATSPAGYGAQDAVKRP